MSGYEKSSPSKLGFGVPGSFEVGYGNTLVGNQVALNRHKLRRAFKTNKVKKAGNIPSACGPFRSAFQLGDPLGRKDMRCGGSNQVNDVNSKVLRHSMGDYPSSVDCAREVHGVTPLEVPLASGNSKYVSDSSLYTQFKHLESVNKTYNDKSGGGDDHNGSYTFIRSVRG
tara:strand:+ start:281 stop:790 length:510 start_codon:yes stop_codon:yes gene_type:complete